MTLIYVDSPVLIAAAKGNELASEAALALIESRVDFASSAYVRLECLPHAVFGKRLVERDFLETFFARVSVWVRPGVAIANQALRHASTGGLGAMDALHVACAIKAEADELVTAEKPTKPINRVAAIRVRTIHPDA